MLKQCFDFCMYFKETRGKFFSVYLGYCFWRSAFFFEDPSFHLVALTSSLKNCSIAFSSALLFMTRCCTIVFQPPLFLLKSSLSFKLLFPQIMSCFFLVAAKIFSIYFVFNRLITMCLGVFLWYYLASGSLNFWFCKFVFDQVWRNFPVISSDIFSCPILFLLSFWDSKC